MIIKIEFQYPESSPGKRIRVRKQNKNQGLNCLKRHTLDLYQNAYNILTFVGKLAQPSSILSL